MLQKFLLTVALSGQRYPHWLSLNSRERRRNAPPARPQSVSFASPQMRTPCGCWHACKPIVRRSAQPATKFWSATASEPGLCGLRLHKFQFGAGRGGSGE